MIFLPLLCCWFDITRPEQWPVLVSTSKIVSCTGSISTKITVVHYYRGTGWYGWRCTAKSLWFLLLPWEVVKFCTVKLFCYDITIYYLFIYLLLETSVENISYCNLWIEEGDERSWESINLLPRISIPCPGTDEIRNAF